VFLILSLVAFNIFTLFAVQNAEVKSPATVYSVAFSPDGRYVLWGSSNMKAGLIDTSSWKIIRKFSGHISYVYSVSFSPDGKYVLTASGDKTLKLWNVVTGNEIRTFKGHREKVVSVAFPQMGDMPYQVAGTTI